MSKSIEGLSYKHKLIDIVRGIPDLWLYPKKAPRVKQNLWHNVGKEMGTSGFDARRQWEILRDQFRREYKRSKTDRSYKSRWTYYNRMLFMRHTLRPRDGEVVNSDMDDQNSPLDGSQIVEQNLDEKMKVELVPKIQVRQDLHGSQESLHASVAGEASTSSGVSSSPGTRLRRVDREQSSQRRRSRRRDERDDEDYHFVMSILPSLQTIPQLRKLRVRSKIMEVIERELESSNEWNSSSQMSQFHIKSEPEEAEVDDKSFFEGNE